VQDNNGNQNLGENKRPAREAQITLQLHAANLTSNLINSLCSFQASFGAERGSSARGYSFQSQKWELELDIVDLIGSDKKLLFAKVCIEPDLS